MSIENARYEDRGRYKDWSQTSMDDALAEIYNGMISIRGAATKYNIPRGTIQDRVHKRVNNVAVVGRPPKLSQPDEQKLVDYASSRASMGVGFSKTNFLRTGSKYLQSRISSNRELITVLVARNANGRCLPPMNIIQGKTSRSLQTVRTGDAPPGTRFTVSDSGWTKMGIMELWFTEHFLPLIGTERPQILILDGHNSHNFVELLKEAQSKNIIIVELPEHTSHWLQPLDRCVFGPFKKAYNAACQALMNDHPGTMVSKCTFCGLLKKAWDVSMTSSNVSSGFKACGIHPMNREIIPQEAYQPSMVSIWDKTTIAATAVEVEQSHESDTVQFAPSGSVNPGIQSTAADGSQAVIDLNDPTVLRLLTEGTDVESVINSADEEPMITDFDINCCSSDNVNDLALHSVESSLSAEQRRRYEAAYAARKTINDNVFPTWKKFKELKPSSPISPSVEIKDQFPFTNSSHPHDPDNDILPYPIHVVKPKPAKTTKYFVLTSQEVINEKKKQADIKREKEMKKVIAKQMRMEKQKKIETSIAKSKTKHVRKSVNSRKKNQ